MRHVIVVLLFLALPAGASAQCGLEWLPGSPLADVGGTVHAMTRWDPDGPGPANELVVFGGGFTAAGNVAVDNIVAFDPSTETWFPFGPGLDDVVYALTVLPNGDLLAGGEFVNSGNTLLKRIARWDGAQWQPLGAGINGLVEALAVLPNGELVAGGWFTMAGGNPARFIARWDGSTWSALGPGPNGWVNTLAVLPNGDLVAGGAFTTAGGVTANNIAQWDGSQWSGLSGGVTGSAGGYFGSFSKVYSLAVLANGDLVVGGNFAAAGGVAASGLVLWSGGQWQALPQMPSSEGVWQLRVLASGDLLAGGLFTLGGSWPIGTVVRWDGVNWTSLGGQYGMKARALLELPAGELLAGGDHTGAGYVRSHVLRWSAGTWQELTSPGGTTNGTVTALITLASGAVVAGGSFTEIGGTPASYVAQHDGAGWVPLGAGVSFGVEALAELPNGDLVAAGAADIAQWDGTQWTPYPQHAGDVTSLAVLPGGDLVAAGRSMSGVPQVSRWTGTYWQVIGLGTASVYGRVEDITVLPNGDIVAAGEPLGAAGGALVRWNGSTWQSLLGGPLSPTALLVDRTGRLVVAGHTYVHRLDGAIWTQLGPPQTLAIEDLTELPSGDLVAVGRLLYPPLPGIARWDGTSWAPVGSGFDYQGGLTMTFAPRGELFVGGNFGVAGGQVSPYVARLATPCPAGVSSAATACVGPAGPLVLSADSRPWCGSTFASTVTGYTNSALAVGLLGFGSPGVPWTWLHPAALPNCEQLAGSEAILLTLPVAGQSGFSWSIPNDPFFAGLPLTHQFLQFALDPQGDIQSLSSSNGLVLTVGAF